MVIRENHKNLHSELGNHRHPRVSSRSSRKETAALSFVPNMSWGSSVRIRGESDLGGGESDLGGGELTQ